MTQTTPNATRRIVLISVALALLINAAAFALTTYTDTQLRHATQDLRDSERDDQRAISDAIEALDHEHQRLTDAITARTHDLTQAQREHSSWNAIHHELTTALDTNPECHAYLD